MPSFQTHMQGYAGLHTCTCMSSYKHIPSKQYINLPVIHVVLILKYNPQYVFVFHIQSYVKILKNLTFHMYFQDRTESGRIVFYIEEWKLYFVGLTT